MPVELENPPEPLELRHLFGCAPGVEVARIQLPEDDAATLEWSGVTAPAQREQGLARLIVSDADDPEGLNVLPYQPRVERIVDDYRYDEAPMSYAFMIVGQAIGRALLEKLAARMTGHAQLSVRSGDLWRQRSPVTVLPLYGTRDSDGMLPYSLAVALDQMLPGRPPLVLVEVGDDTARLDLSEREVARGTLEPG